MVGYMLMESNYPAPNSFWNEDLNLGICGDYFSGFKAEHAFLSAKHLCLQVQKTLL